MRTTSRRDPHFFLQRTPQTSYTAFPNRRLFALFPRR